MVLSGGKSYYDRSVVSIYSTNVVNLTACIYNNADNMIWIYFKMIFWRCRCLGNARSSIPMPSEINNKLVGVATCVLVTLFISWWLILVHTGAVMLRCSMVLLIKDWIYLVEFPVDTWCKGNVITTSGCHYDLIKFRVGISVIVTLSVDSIASLLRQNCTVAWFVRNIDVINALCISAVGSGSDLDWNGDQPRFN